VACTYRHRHTRPLTRRNVYDVGDVARTATIIIAHADGGRGIESNDETDLPRWKSISYLRPSAARPPSARGAFYPASQRWIRPIAEQERSRRKRNLPSKFVVLESLWLFNAQDAATSISPRYLRTFSRLKTTLSKRMTETAFYLCIVGLHARLTIVIPPDDAYELLAILLIDC